MLVDPLSIRPLQLFLHEFLRRVPHGNSCDPLEWDADQAQTIPYRDPLPHPDGRWRKDLDLQLGRRHDFHVRRLGEEREDALSSEREIELRPKRTRATHIRPVVL